MHYLGHGEDFRSLPIFSRNRLSFKKLTKLKANNQNLVTIPSPTIAQVHVLTIPFMANEIAF
jgi:hypothetical protein